MTATRTPRSDATFASVSAIVDGYPEGTRCLCVVVPAGNLERTEFYSFGTGKAEVLDILALLHGSLAEKTPDIVIDTRPASRKPS